MGRGKGYLEMPYLSNGTIIIQNDYSSFTDTLHFQGGYKIWINGEINMARGEGKEKVSNLLQRTDEPFVDSFKGQFWKPLSGLSPIYGRIQKTISFTNDDLAEYKCYVEKTGKIITEKLLYYIPRKHHSKGDLIYTHSSSEINSNLIIYNSSIYELE